MLRDAEVAFRIQDRVTDLFEPMVSYCIARETLLGEIEMQAYIEVGDPNTSEPLINSWRFNYHDFLVYPISP
jgi:hypothetical protein